MGSRKDEPVGQAWFYHTPPTNIAKSRVGYPLLSQIPGLNRSEPEAVDAEPKQGWIRECDSAYVRLAKQGGRPDLLNMQPKVIQKVPAVSSTYKRCDWYYHDMIGNQSNVKGSEPCPSEDLCNVNSNRNEEQKPRSDPLKLD